MELFIRIFAICAFVYAVKEIDGPWGVMAWARNALMRLPFLGVFFYKLLACYFCLGFHAGWIIYTIAERGNVIWNSFLLWGLAGAAISLIFSGVLEQLYKGSSE